MVGVHHIDTQDSDFVGLQDPAFDLTFTGNSASCQDISLVFADDGQDECAEFFTVDIISADPGGSLDEPSQATGVIVASGDSGSCSSNSNEYVFSSEGDGGGGGGEGVQELQLSYLCGHWMTVERPVLDPRNRESSFFRPVINVPLTALFLY